MTCLAGSNGGINGSHKMQWQDTCIRGRDNKLLASGSSETASMSVVSPLTMAAHPSLSQVSMLLAMDNGGTLHVTKLLAIDNGGTHFSPLLLAASMVKQTLLVNTLKRDPL